MEQSEKLLEENRLWIGNLDPRVTEYHLLKLVQKYGSIEKFDLLFHRTGPLAGQPRGYAFVTYVNLEDARNAREKLNNLLVGQKHITVTWAHASTEESYTKPVEKINIPVLAIAKPETKTNRNVQIQAIEAKLKLMENKKEDLTINDSVAKKTPVITKYQQNIQSNNTALKSQTKVLYRNKPYNKNKTHR